VSRLLLPWTTRGVTYGSRDYLAGIGMALDDHPAGSSPGPVTPDTPFTDAIPILARLRGTVGRDIEYGCFHHDGTLIDDPGLLFKRQSRNILYYVIRDLYNLSRGQDQLGPGGLPGNDPVPNEPEGRWGLLLTEACPHKDQIAHALAPLVTHRAGTVMTLPSMATPPQFLTWLQEQFNAGTLPPYLLIADSFENLPLEYQFILNAFAVTGRLWLDDPDAYQVYGQKVLDVEGGKFPVGPRRLVATPMDDDVTYADYQNIIAPLLPALEAASFSLEPLIGAPDFDQQSLLGTAEDARFLALYCHGLALSQEEWQQRPDLQGAFVLQIESEGDEGLLTADELAAARFVPGGILFSPACLGAGTQANSDFVAWIDPDSLAPYLSASSFLSANSQALLGSATGPAAVLGHFDISMAGNAPMHNPMTQADDLQRELHLRFIENLGRGQTIGKATEPFRWAAGAFYAQAIYIFGQITGKVPYFGPPGVRKTIGQFVNSMNRYHVTATDMRNTIILGDPAVRLPG
jgi:hypothetical protein